MRVLLEPIFSAVLLSLEMTMPQSCIAETNDTCPYRRKMAIPESDTAGSDDAAGSIAVPDGTTAPGSFAIWVLR
jgi:hypothetical protein